MEAAAHGGNELGIHGCAGRPAGTRQVAFFQRFAPELEQCSTGTVNRSVGGLAFGSAQNCLVLATTVWLTGLMCNHFTFNHMQARLGPVAANLLSGLDPDWPT